jgi:hypothetical protein
MHLRKRETRITALMVFKRCRLVRKEEERRRRGLDVIEAANTMSC